MSSSQGIQSSSLAVATAIAVENSAGTKNESAVVAESAHTSSKRARLLFSVAADDEQQQAMLPFDLGVEDATLAARSRQRRRRFMTGEAAATSTSTLSSLPRLTNEGVAGEGREKSLVVVENVGGAGNGALVLRGENDTTRSSDVSSARTSGILVKANHENGDSTALARRGGAIHIPTPQWHAPWKLSTVLSSHLGWVRALAFSADNKFLATGSADRTIKLWNFAAASVGDEQNSLQLTLTGHISPVRGLAFSPRLAYLFSCGEDKKVKCWDLETNQVVRQYHGHLSGVFCMALHPTLDVLVTAGRDAVARVWDIRTRHAIHVLEGHEHTIASVLTQSTHPQVITGSHDTTIKMWDLVAGKCFTTLTHHQKSVRAMVKPSFTHTFCSGAPDCLKQWQAKDGRFLQSLTGHKAIVNAMAVNDDGVLVSGADDGSMHFWDYNTGYTFQKSKAIVQPGTLEAENAIYAMAFDATGTRLVTGEGDKSIKIWKPDMDASELTHPIDMAAWRKKKIAQSKQRY